jgi:hypothetical protein
MVCATPITIIGSVTVVKKHYDPHYGNKNDMAAHAIRFKFLLLQTAKHYGSFASQIICWHLPSKS